MQGLFRFLLSCCAVPILIGCASMHGEPQAEKSRPADDQQLMASRLSGMEERMSRIERNLGLEQSSAPGRAANDASYPAPALGPAGNREVSAPLAGEGSLVQKPSLPADVEAGPVNDALKDLSVSFAPPLAASPGREPASAPSTNDSVKNVAPAATTSHPVLPATSNVGRTAPKLASVEHGGPGKTSAAASKSDLQHYEAALASYHKGKYAEAERAFSGFMKQYPQSSLVPNALYWLGECLYSTGKYDAAIIAFKDVAGKYPGHDKAAAALLKAGYSYSELKDQENARFYWQILIDDFPGSAPANLARERLAGL